MARSFSNVFFILIVFELIAIIALIFSIIFVRSNNTQVFSTAISSDSLDNSNQYYFNSHTDLSFTTPKGLTQVNYRTNNDGLNEKYDIDIQKPDNTVRIITLGNSFVFGLFVNTQDNFSEVLEKLLNDRSVCKSTKKFEVINLGAPGFDFDYSINILLDKGMKYSPDKILWMIQDESVLVPNSWFYAEREKSIDKLRKSLGPETFKDQYEGYKKELMVDLERSIKDEILLKHGKEEIDLYLTDKYLSLVTEHPVPTYFFSFDNRLTSKSSSLISEILKMSPEGSKLLKQITGLTRNENHFTDDRHPNELGHKLIAQHLFDQINSDICIN